MTPLDAVAAAIRERLLAGQPAPLPGLGTLVRKHVAARVEERADGTRMMLPPGETIGLDPTATGAESLSTPFARFLSLTPNDAGRAYTNAMDQLEARLAATGEVRLPGVGLLRRTSSGVVLGVEAELLAAVNRTYEGLSPVSPPSSDSTITHHHVPRPHPTGTSAPEPSRPSATPPAPPPSDPEPTSEPRVSSPSETEAPRPEDFDGPIPSRTDDASEPPFVPPIDVVPPSEDDRPEPSPAPPTDTASPAEPTAPSDPPGDAPPLATPFGDADGPDPADVLPPTPPDREPPPSAPPSAPSSPPDDDAIWTAPSFAARPSFDDEADVLDSLIEDADFDVVPSPSPPDAPEPTEAVGPTPPPEPGDTFPSSDTPDDEASAGAPPPEAPEPPPDPAPEPAPPVAALASPEEPEPTPKRKRHWGLWIVLLLLLALAAVAVALFWPDIEPRLRGLIDGESNETMTAEAAPSRTPNPFQRQPLAAPDSLRLPEDRVVPVPDPDTQTDATDANAASDGTGAGEGTQQVDQATPNEGAIPRTGLGQAPPPGVAILPPRLSGLSNADIRALTDLSAPINPAAEAWTLVVLSTPSLEEAEALRQRYRRAGYRTAVLISRSGNYRVAIGQFANREDAIRLRERIPPQAPGDTWLLDLQTL